MTQTIHLPTPLRCLRYILARILGDLLEFCSKIPSALKSGKPAKVARRIRNKAAGRVVSKRLYK